LGLTQRSAANFFDVTSLGVFRRSSGTNGFGGGSRQSLFPSAEESPSGDVRNRRSGNDLGDSPPSVKMKELAPFANLFVEKSPFHSKPPLAGIAFDSHNWNSLSFWLFFGGISLLRTPGGVFWLSAARIPRVGV